MFFLTLTIMVIIKISFSFVAFPQEYYPAKASPNNPRLWIKNDLERLKKVYADSTNVASSIFKNEINKMMSYSSYDGDWRYASGWPVAALALAWRITGNSTYGTKAIKTYLPYFDGKPKVIGRLQSITHFALGYDWLLGHPDFTDQIRTDLENKMIAWSDSEYTSDTTVVSYIAQDSDHLTASTTSHFVAGLAMYGMNDKAVTLMDRGWTGIKQGYNDNTLLPNVSIEDMFNKTKNGIPLPGWDYFWMSDGWDLQNLIYILDELGYVSDVTKKWWPNAIKTFIHNIDPANTHYRWVGDTQSDVFLTTYTGYIWSGVSNCIYMAEKYGFITEAAQGRFFLDNLNHASYGISEGDPMLFMAEVTTQPPLELMELLQLALPCQDISSMKGWVKIKEWPMDFSELVGQKILHGGFSGIGNYLVDHMHAIHGSYFLWRNGEYLTTDPHNYGGEAAGQIFNSLSIPNPVTDNEGGPLFYANQYAAFLERGRINADGKCEMFYSMLNANGSYNVPDYKYDTCNGCGKPVKYYHRHFYYDGQDFVFIIDKVKMNYANYTAWRFRTQSTQAPSQIASDSISVLSDKGNYRTLIRILEPQNPSWTFVNEKDYFTKNNVQNWQIDTTMWGYQSKATTNPNTDHLWIAVLHIGNIGSGTTQLNSSSKITSDAGMIGMFAGNSVFIVANDQTLRTSASYSTPSQMVQDARHIVGDLVSGCYIVQASIDGNIGKLVSKDSDNTIIFNTVKSGVQTITISSASGCDSSNNGICSSNLNVATNNNGGTSNSSGGDSANSNSNNTSNIRSNNCEWLKISLSLIFIFILFI